MAILRSGWLLVALAAVASWWVVPDDWLVMRVGILWVGLLVLPGLALVDLVFGRQRLLLVERVPFAFCASLGILAVPATAAYVWRLPMSAVTPLVVGVAALAVGAGVLARRTAGDARPDGDGATGTLVAGAALAGLIGLVSMFAARHAGYAFTDRLADVWFHLAFVRRLTAAGIADPANPFLPGEGVEFVYGYNVWHLVLALFSRWTGADPVDLWAAVVPFAAAVVLASVFPLARALMGERLAIAATLAYVVLHGVVSGMDSLLFSPKPASIAIWVFPAVVLALFIRYVERGERRVLWAAALVNVVPAVVHFVEPMGVLLALGLLAAALWGCGADRIERRRVLTGLAAVAIVFLIVFALKSPLIHGQARALSTYTAHRPIQVGMGMIMTDPFSSGLRDPIQLAALAVMPLLFPWLRTHRGVQLLVLVPILYLVLQYNPVLATLASALTGEVFVRKGISFLRVFHVITLTVVIVHYGPLLARRARTLQAPRPVTPRGVAAIALGVAAATTAVAYAAYFVPALIRFGQTTLAVPERHALKGFFVGPVGMALLTAVTLALVGEVLRPTIGPVLRRWAGDSPRCPPGTLRVAAVGTIVLVLAAAPLLERRLSQRAGRPYPTDLRSVIPAEYRYLREAAPSPTVVLVKPRDRAFDQQTPAFFLQAFTSHYAVALPDPDFKGTRSAVDYPARFRDVNRVYGGSASVDDVRRIAAAYDVRFIVASRGDSSRPLFELLRSDPAGFPIVFEREGVGVFQVAAMAARSR